MKYELTEYKNTIDGHTLHQIRACKDFTCSNGVQVYAGELGGYIENTNNLSQQGTCWIMERAMVYGNARVEDDAQIRFQARVFGNAHVYQQACVRDSAKVYGNAQVYGRAYLSHKSEVMDNARVYGGAGLDENARVFDNAKVHDETCVQGCAMVYGDAEILGFAYIGGYAHIFGNAKVMDSVAVQGYARIYRNSQIQNILSSKQTTLGFDVQQDLRNFFGNSIIMSDCCESNVEQDHFGFITINAMPNNEDY